MAKYKVDITGINTSEIEVLSNEEMTRLFVEYQNGNLDAKDRLINGNLKLVLSILRTFNKGNVNLDDLFQVGVIGLIKAIDNFDLSYGLKLSTYAVPLIIGEIKRYLRDNTAVRVSRSTKDLAYQIIKFKDKYLSEHGIDAPPSVISKELDIPEYLISYAMDAMRDPASIFEPIYNDGGDTIYLFDQIEDRKTDNSNIDTKMSVREAISNLSRREQLVLEERFVIGKTQMEISEELGISQAQVSRIEKGIIDSLREKLR